jgi:sugar-specific transcriptional regulator TrmB
MDTKKYLQNSFIDFGLSKEVGKVYFSILRATGRADASRIKKETRSSTASVYRMIDLLISKGFISPSSASRPITYAAVPFRNLAKKFEARGRKFTQISSRLKELGEFGKKISN